MMYVSKMIPAPDKGRFFAFGRVFAGRSHSAGPEIVLPGFDWQMPQGGIDANEDIVAAARRELEASHAATLGALRAEHASALNTARVEAVRVAREEAERELEAKVTAAVDAAQKAAERDKRAALRSTAAEAEKALKRVLEAAAVQQAKAVADARRQFEEELLGED